MSDNSSDLTWQETTSSTDEYSEDVCGKCHTRIGVEDVIYLCMNKNCPSHAALCQFCNQKAIREISEAANKKRIRDRYPEMLLVSFDESNRWCSYSCFCKCTSDLVAVAQQRWAKSVYG